MSDNAQGARPSGPRATIPEPIDHISNSTPDSWGTPESAGPKLSFKFKAVAAMTGAVVLIGGLTYLTAPKEQVLESVNLDNKTAPFMSAKTQARVTTPRTEVEIKCDNEFVAGPHSVLDDVVNGYPFTIRNKHKFQILVMIFNDASSERVQMVGLEPKTTEDVVLPEGKYRLEVFAGENWCSSEIGFKDGVKVNMKGTIHIKEKVASKLDLIPDGLQPGDFNPRLVESPREPDADASKTSVNQQSVPKQQSKREQRPQEDALARESGGEKRATPQGCPPARSEEVIPLYEVTGNDSLRLRPLAGGNYYVTGSANGFPVVYTVDTGAPTIVFPQHLAARAGIRSCTQKTIQTHMGYIKGCFAPISELAFGDYKVRNVEAMILQNATGDAVIGMSLLKRFKVEQINGVIQISKAKI